MRRLTTVLAGTLVACLMTETAAIAQVEYYYPPVLIERELSYIPFGRTRGGEQLGLAPESLIPVQGGVRFTYYLNNQAITGFTDCRNRSTRATWYVNGRGYAATSTAAKNMMEFICSTRRVSWGR